MKSQDNLSRVKAVSLHETP